MGEDFKGSFTLTEGNEICSFSEEMNISQAIQKQTIEAFQEMRLLIRLKEKNYYYFFQAIPGKEGRKWGLNICIFQKH